MKPIAVLDACVLYPATVRDFFIRLYTVGGFYLPRWSPHIHEEWSRNLLEDRPTVKRSSIERTINLMNRLPDTLIRADRYEKSIKELNLPDKDDRHVLAAAAAVHADYIITFNLRDFPSSECSKVSVIPIHPDDFVQNLINISKGRLIQTIKNQSSSMKNPPVSCEDLLNGLVNKGLPSLALLDEA